MPTFTLAELVKPVTRQEAQASIYSALEILGVKTTSWKPGAVPRATIVGTSIVLAAFSNLMSLITKSGFLELSEGPWLTLVAHYLYKVERIEASFASGELEISNASGGEYLLDPGDLIFAAPSTDATYRNTAAVRIAPLAPSTTVAVVATEAGSASSADPDTITEFVTTLLGLTCTNPLALIGRDEETDPALRTRCSAKLGSLSPFGPWDAYASAARGATRADGSSLGITRIRTTKDGYGGVGIICATDSGPVPMDDLAIVEAAVALSATPLGVTANVSSAEALPIPITYEAWMYNTSGLTPMQVEDAINARVRAFVSTQPIGGNKLSNGADGFVFVDAINAAITSTLPEIFRVVVSVPASDFAIEPDQVAVYAVPTCLGIHEIAPPEESGG